MTNRIGCRYHGRGRDFMVQEMTLLRALIAGPLAINRHALSKVFRQRIGWASPTAASRT